MPKTPRANVCPHCGRHGYAIFLIPAGYRCNGCHRSEFVR